MILVAADVTTRRSGCVNQTRALSQAQEPLSLAAPHASARHWHGHGHAGCARAECSSRVARFTGTWQPPRLCAKHDDTSESAGLSDSEPGRSDGTGSEEPTTSSSPLTAPLTEAVRACLRACHSGTVPVAGGRLAHRHDAGHRHSAALRLAVTVPLLSLQPSGGPDSLRPSLHPDLRAHAKPSRYHDKVLTNAAR
jgi:hypothetical protein